MYTELFLEIAKKYEQQQKEAFDALEVRRQEAYKQVPELAEIDEKIKKTGLLFNRRILAQDSPADDPIVIYLEDEINNLKAIKNELLISNGMGGNFLEPIFKCPACRDTGYISTLKGSERCSCFKQQLINAFYGVSNLRALDTQNFSSFNEELFSSAADEQKYGLKASPRENILGIRNKCLHFIDRFETSQEKNLLFFGAPGLGKTFLTNCIAKELLDRGKTVLYQTAPVLFEITNEHRIRSLSDEDYQDSRYKSIFDVELLIIDDLGTETISEAKVTELFHILNTRILNNELRPCKTIISTNLSPSQMQDKYTARVLSRVSGHFGIYKFIGEDIRSNRKLAR